MAEFSAEVLLHQAFSYTDAIKLKLGNGSLPKLSQYIPQSLEEFEIQQFNLLCTIPSRLQNEEDVAMWLLESDKLCRANVARYLTDSDSSDMAQAVLEKLAAKVCSLEVANGFAEGLKFFVPVVGCLEFVNGEVDSNDSKLRYFLTAYSRAHMTYSDTPLFPQANSVNYGYDGQLSSQEQLHLLIEISYCVLRLCKAVAHAHKPQSALMSAFFSDVRGVFQHSNNVAMSIKSMTDLFMSATGGRNIAPLNMPDNVPSFLFANVKMEGPVTVGFSMEETLVSYYVKLCSDALYLFHFTNDGDNANNLPASNSHNIKRSSGFNVSKCGDLVGCIPLEALHVQLVDYMEHITDDEDCNSNCYDSSNDGDIGLLEFVSVSDKSLPFIWFSGPGSANALDHADHGNTSFLFKSSPIHLKEVSYHDSILFNVGPAANWAFRKSKSSISTALNDTCEEFQDMNKFERAGEYNAATAAASQPAGMELELDDFVAEWVDIIESCCWAYRAQQQQQQQLEQQQLQAVRQ